MKFQKIVIAMLSLLLILNAVGIGIMIKEEKAQTEIASQQIELALYTAMISKAGAESSAYCLAETDYRGMKGPYEKRIHYAFKKIEEMYPNFYAETKIEIKEMYNP